MSRQIAYFCPGCQSIDVEITIPRIIDPTQVNGGATYKCPLCLKTGPAVDLISALSPQNEQFWTMERISMVLLKNASKHAAGPMVQLLELIGLLPNPETEESAEGKKSAADVREAVIKEVLGAIVTSAFQAAAEHAGPHFKKYTSEAAEPAQRIFSYGMKEEA